MLSFKALFKEKNPPPAELVENTLQLLFEKGGFSLSFKLKQQKDVLFVDIYGEDEELLKAREGKLLQALQVYFSRILQRKQIASKETGLITLYMDCGKFLEEREEKLFFLVGKLRKKALSTGQPVYLKKSLPPFQRRKIHKFLAEEGGVETSSIGNGFYKTMCISPVHSPQNSHEEGFFE